MLSSEEWKFVALALQLLRSSTARTGAKSHFPAVRSAMIKQMEVIHETIRKVNMEVERETEATRKR